jgi:hypothetical protein
MSRILLPQDTRIRFTITALLDNASLPHCDGTIVSFVTLGGHTNYGGRYAPLTELEVKWDEPGHPTVLYDYSLEDIDIVPGDTGE